MKSTLNDRQSIFKVTLKNATKTLEYTTIRFDLGLAVTTVMRTKIMNPTVVVNLNI